MESALCPFLPSSVVLGGLCTIREPCTAPFPFSLIQVSTRELSRHTAPRNRQAHPSYLILASMFLEAPSSLCGACFNLAGYRLRLNLHQYFTRNTVFWKSHAFDPGSLPSTVPEGRSRVPWALNALPNITMGNKDNHKDGKDQPK